MHDLSVLRDPAIIGGLAIPIVALAHRVGVPPLVGFVLVGVLIGPPGLGSDRCMAQGLGVAGSRRRGRGWRCSRHGRPEGPRGGRRLRCSGPTRIAHELAAVQNEHYGLLRGTAAPDLTLDTLKHLGIHDALELVEVEAGADAIDQDARMLDLRQRTGAIQIAVVRDGQPIYRRDQTFRYRLGDTAVLVGDRDALDRAAALFRNA